MIKKIIKNSIKLLSTLLFDGHTKLNKFSNNLFQVIHLKPRKGSRGNVLLSYIIEPFLNNKISNYHTNYWECKEMAKIFLDRGFCVDVIDWRNKNFVPKKNYKVVIDIHDNLKRISLFLNKNCIKIHHITAAHWLFQNKAEYSRLLDLKNRKGIILIPRRIVPPSFNIEYADYATILGNEFTINTYAYANKQIYRIPISTTETYPSPEKKSFEKCKNNFLWLGGGGMVHKGLDLVLEAFADMPNFHLTVCGPVNKEKDFEKAYYKELYETPNIKTVGRIDINSQQFLEIINNCIGLVYPSCSEGQAGSVITCMHAGLIPLISYQSGVDVKDFGIIFEENTVEEIKNSIKKISSASAQELKTKSIASWKYARENHTREKFSKEYKKTINKILNI